MTLSIKKKNGSKTRKRILKSRKNILRGSGSGKEHFGSQPKATHVQAPRTPAPAPAPRSSEPQPAPKSVKGSVLSFISPQVSNLKKKIANLATSGLRKTVFRQETKNQEAKARLASLLKTVQGPPGAPKTSMDYEALRSM